MKSLYYPNAKISIPKSVYSPYSAVYTKKRTPVKSSDGSKFLKFSCSPSPGNRHYILLDEAPKIKKSLDYISVPPGVGKTKWAVDYIVKNSKAKKDILVYCAPTTTLLKQVFMEVKSGFNFSASAKLNITYRGVQEDKDLSPYMGFKDMSDIRPMTYYASYLMENMGRGSCLFITHATFLSIKEHLRKGRYHVIFDEAAEMQIVPDRLQIDQKSVALLNTMVAFEIFPKPEVLKPATITQNTLDKDFYPYYRLRCLDTGDTYKDNYKKLADITKNQKLSRLIEKACEDQFSVFVKEEIQKHSSTYYFFDFVTPTGIFEGFDKVTLLSAFFEESLMYRILTQSYNLVNVNHLVDSKREKAIYEGYKNLEIVYLFDFPRTLSKNFLDNAVYVKPGKEKHYLKFLERYVPILSQDILIDKKDASKVLVDHLVKAPNNRVLKIMEKRMKEKDYDRFDYVASKTSAASDRIQKVIRKDLRRRKEQNFKVVDKPLVIANLSKTMQGTFGTTNYVDLMVPIHEDFEWLRTKSHGLNSFTKRNVFISLAALNLQPYVLSFYSFLIPDFDTSLMSTHTILQGVTRTRIRKIDNKKKVLLYVFSKKEAEALHHAFKGKPKLTSLENRLENFYVGNTSYYDEEAVKKKKEVSATKKKLRNKINTKAANAKYRQDPEYVLLKVAYDKAYYAHRKADPESSEAKKLRKELDKINTELKERRAFLKHNKVE